MPAPTSKAQARFEGAIAGGTIKKKGFSAKEAKDRLRGVSMKDLPERAVHLAPHNANTSLTVTGSEPSEDGRVMLHLEGEGGATASLPFTEEEAAAYPEGSTVVLHCVPSAEEPEAQDNATEEAGEGPPPVGRKPIPKSLKMGMLLEKYHGQKENA